MITTYLNDIFSGFVFLFQKITYLTYLFNFISLLVSSKFLKVFEYFDKNIFNIYFFFKDNQD